MRQVKQKLTLKLGEGVKKDPKKALEFYKKAKKLGSIKAQYNLGLVYEMGKSKLKINMNKLYQRI